MTFGEFFERHVLAPAPPPPAAAAPEEGGCGPNPSSGSPGGSQRVGLGYLAQHPLLEQIPALRRDVLAPDYCALGDGEVQAVNAWIGPQGTVSPAHTDPHHNVLCQARPGAALPPPACRRCGGPALAACFFRFVCGQRRSLAVSPAQVVGHKFVRLFAPSETPRLYPHAEGMCTNSSRVDLHRPDAGEFPLFAEAAFEDALLGPGDALFIPRGWWHFVQSCSPSASVSFWWR